MRKYLPGALIWLAVAALACSHGCGKKKETNAPIDCHDPIDAWMNVCHFPIVMDGVNPMTFQQAYDSCHDSWGSIWWQFVRCYNVAYLQQNKSCAAFLACVPDHGFVPPDDDGAPDDDDDTSSPVDDDVSPDDDASPADDDAAPDDDDNDNDDNDTSPPADDDASPADDDASPADDDVIAPPFGNFMAPPNVNGMPAPDDDAAAADDDASPAAAVAPSPEPTPEGSRW